MKNLFLVLICFAFAGVALQAQTDATIPNDAIGTYTLWGTDATAVVSATNIVATVGSSTVSDGSGGAATSGSGGSDTSPDDGLSKSAPGLHDVRKTRRGGWGGIYTTEDGKDIPVMLELVKHKDGRRGILVKERSGAVLARYIRE